MFQQSCVYTCRSRLHVLASRKITHDSSSLMRLDSSSVMNSHHQSSSVIISQFLEPRFRQPRFRPLRISCVSAFMQTESVERAVLNRMRACNIRFHVERMRRIVGKCLRMFFNRSRKLQKNKTMQGIRKTSSSLEEFGIHFSWNLVPIPKGNS